MATYMCKSFLPFFILVSFCFIARTDAVICAVKHPQTVVCEAGFVIRATVLSVAAKTCVYNNSNIAVPIASAAFLPASSQNGNFIPTEKIITVRLDKLFKGYKVINNKKGTLLKINFQSPFSVPLQPGMQYLLTGFLINGKLHMNSCSWYQFWSMTTVTQYYGLRRYYWMYCRCKVEHCSNRICRRTLRNCLWKPDNLSSAIGKMDCHSRYSICMVRNGRCTLHNPKGAEFAFCQKLKFLTNHREGSFTMHGLVLKRISMLEHYRRFCKRWRWGREAFAFDNNAWCFIAEFIYNTSWSNAPTSSYE